MQSQAMETRPCCSFEWLLCEALFGSKSQCNRPPMPFLQSPSSWRSPHQPPAYLRTRTRGPSALTRINFLTDLRAHECRRPAITCGVLSIVNAVAQHFHADGLCVALSWSAQAPLIFVDLRTARSSQPRHQTQPRARHPRYRMSRAGSHDKLLRLADIIKTNPAPNWPSEECAWT